MNKLVKIIPKSKRAKTRVKEPGPIMRAIKENAHNIMVESLEQTWQGTTWLGWFTKEEAGWEEIE